MKCELKSKQEFRAMRQDIVQFCKGIFPAMCAFALCLLYVTVIIVGGIGGTTLVALHLFGVHIPDPIWVQAIILSGFLLFWGLILRMILCRNASLFPGVETLVRRLVG